MNEFLKTIPDITAWLCDYEIKNYDLIRNETYGFVVNVRYDIDLKNKNLTHIPVKFNHASGIFNCSYNQLTTLSFAPSKVGRYFDCSHNQITSLFGSPRSVGEFFDCGHNQLTSLQYCPEVVDGNFDCCSNAISNFEYCPQSVDGKFLCYDNPALGIQQDLTYFRAIDRIHQKFVKIKEEKNWLDHSIKASNQVQFPTRSKI